MYCEGSNNFNFHKLVNINYVDGKVLKLFWSYETKNAINTQLDGNPYTL